MKTLSLGYSPCPNDTFIFYALVHKKIPLEGYSFTERLEDVETLNQLASRNELDITKVSFHAFAHLRDHYALLRSGGALGKGCGPLVVAGQGVTSVDLRHRRIEGLSCSVGNIADISPDHIIILNSLSEIHNDSRLSSSPFQSTHP